MSAPERRRDCSGHCGRQLHPNEVACSACWERLPDEMRRRIVSARERRDEKQHSTVIAHETALLAADRWWDEQARTSPEQDQPDVCEHDETASGCQRCRMTAAEVMGGTLPDPSKATGWTAYLTETQRMSLPGVYHRPHFDGLGNPTVWTCTACWGDGWMRQWPCEKATEAGVELAKSLNVGWSW